MVPPPTLRKKFIQAVHDDIHCGASSTRHRVKLEAWWPGHCDDIERYVKNCATCAKIKPPAATNVHVWPQEQEAWSRVHIDHGYVDGYGLLLILVDAYSGWPEVVRVANRSAKTVQYVLRVIFARNGVPRKLVSDNAAEFKDLSLCEWLKKIGCEVIKSPPHHPKSNGLAERMVSNSQEGIKSIRPK